MTVRYGLLTAFALLAATAEGVAQTTSEKSEWPEGVTLEQPAPGCKKMYPKQDEVSTLCTENRRQDACVKHSFCNWSSIQR